MRTGLVAVLLHPLRSAVTTACVVAVLLPYLAGLGVSKGIQRQAVASIRFGADLYVTGGQFGRTVPIPVSAAPAVRSLEGVVSVVPRIVGSVVLGKNNEQAVLVGMPAKNVPPLAECVSGRLFRPSSLNELVVGTGLAERLKLKIGARIPPFYRNSRGERVSEVVGIFKSEVAIWQSHMIFTSFETAAAIFDQENLATDLLVRCRPGYEERVAQAISRIGPFVRAGGGDPIHPRILAREELAAIVPRGLLHQEGIFNLHFVLAFAVGIAVVLVVSGFGSTERRREIGILKATGWQTDQVLLRGLAESMALGILAGSLSVLGAFVWLRLFNGYWIASVFLSGANIAPTFEVPFELAPVPTVLGLLVACVVVLSGTLYSSWKAAITSPVEAMR